jgi:hypothetical protein
MTHVPRLSSGPSARLRRAAVGLAAGLLLALPLPTAVAAQSYRVQGAWVGGNVAGALFGVEFRHLLGSAPPIPGTGSGPLVAGTRNWMLTGMAGVGANFAPRDASGVLPLFYAHLGVLHRTGSDLVPRVGLVAADYLRARALGPQLLVELEGVVDAQVGAFHTPDGWKAGVSVAVALRFLQDILGG